MAKPKIGVIIGSTRPGRFADKPAEWIAERAAARGDFDVEIIDLRDYPMPFFDEERSPAWAPSKSEVAQKWQKKIDELDGYIFLAAEYNHGPTAVLKNAIDYAFNEWSRKPAAFVGYGGVGGARAVEQLRLHAVEVEMTPIRVGVHILWPDYMAVTQGTALGEIEHLNTSADTMLDQFTWWVNALKTARDKDAATAKAA
ncbi:NAD(P)H-dependent oxidoreductase [Aquamicrobium sp. LC103]|uniref:NADPH-dependent FMN reductase n=1 Tax=Aquamicrobium sp. LC103 TaxID=1120658 RepID=UPI00063E7C1B|nr:NAD(P)H-dependent oxidoreductase [Aquamicrobium sp. LC103]TKT80393.1 NAD(P)H-dependent oxidoreductase [Aquamicrobium sp. LC103]